MMDLATALYIARHPLGCEDDQVHRARAIVCDEVERLQAAVTVPDTLVCPVCQCKSTHVAVRPGIAVPVPTSEPCPNGCGAMQRMTWQEAHASLMECYQMGGVARAGSDWTPRHSSVQRFALRKFSSQARHMAEIAAHDKDGRWFQPSATAQFLDDARTADECLEMLGPAQAAAPAPAGPPPE